MAISLLNDIITPSAFVLMNVFTLFISLLFLTQMLISGSKKLFQTKKSIAIKSNVENQGFVVRTLINLVICDIILASSSVAYSIWELVGVAVPAFRENESNIFDIKSPYWVHLRVLRCLGVVGYAANYSSGSWTVCFAIALYLSLKARGQTVRFRLFWEILFHFFSTFISISGLVIWLLYRTISTETLFFENNPRTDGVFVGIFYLSNAIVTILQFLVDMVVCLLIWRLVSKSVRLVRGSNSIAAKKARAAEWRLMFRLSLFLLPWLMLGSSNIIWYVILTYQSFTLKSFPFPTFVDYFLVFHSIIIPLKGCVNAVIYGFNAHRIDKRVASCFKCLCRRKREKYEVVRSMKYSQHIQMSEKEDMIRSNSIHNNDQTDNTIDYDTDNTRTDIFDDNHSEMES